MAKLITCIVIEGKKLSKSRVPLLTALALTLVPFMGGFFMFILKDPALAQELGFISAKAQILGTATWPSYLSLLAQAMAIGGILVFGFISSWIFGREYSDRTITDLLALPISRTTIVLAKFIVSFLWCLILSLYVLILGYLVGLFVHLPGWSPALVTKGAFIFLICSALTTILSTPVGFFASSGRGYLPPLGFTVFTLVLAQIVAATGYGHYFPWAIPAVLSGIAGSSHSIGKSSIIIVLATAVFGLISTIVWWRCADHS